MISALVALALAGAPPHGRPGEALLERAWDVRHLDLDVAIDPVAGTVEGVATHTVSPLGPRSRWLRLHQVALQIDEVRVDGAVVEGWRRGEQTLDVPMPLEGHAFEVAVRYRARPENGLHFRGPARGDAVIEAWSQGEDEDNRYWYPAWDFPNDKFTATVALTVPEGLVALATGEARGEERLADGRRRVAFALEQPVPNYLVAVAVGEYAVTRIDGPVPVENVVARGTSAVAASAALGAVVPMIPWMEARLGVDYPFARVRQVAVQRFLYGGMENPSLTVIADHYVAPSSPARPWDGEEVVAHELAHHWFGDLITTWGWRDLWLNEGFATLLAWDWQAESQGPTFAAVQAREHRRWAVGGAHPMAPRAWSGAEEDNASVYSQGLTVLRQARDVVGEPAFDAGVHALLASRGGDFATSEDLRVALEQASGRDLGWLFDQFVHGAGHPEIEASWAWAEGVLTVTLDQGEGEWDLPLTLELGGEAPQRRTVWVGPGRTTATFELETDPAWVAVDPDALSLAAWSAEQQPEAWLAQLRGSPSAAARLDAMGELAALPTEGAVAALLAAADDDSAHPLYRAEALLALGEHGGDEAFAALLARATHPHAVIREAAIDALAEARPTDAVRRALTRAATQEADDRVRASALQVLGAHDGADALPLARQQLGRGGPWTRSVAIGLLGEHGERRDLATVLRHGEPGERDSVRFSAARAGAAIALRLDEDGPTDAVIDALDQQLRDADLRLREAAVDQLSRLPGAGPTLRAFAAETQIPWLRDAALDAAVASARLGRDEGEEEPDEAAEPDTGEALEALQQRLEEAMERLERLEAQRP